jgi:hypothetical protein
MENTDIESTSVIEPNSNAFVDKITLELLMNKNHYRRYIAKTDPNQYDEMQEHLQTVSKHRNSILQITTDLLNNPNKQITTEVNEIFDAYVKTLIRHFKMKELETTNPYNKNQNQDQDEDVLFGQMDETSETNSFWSNERVKKMQTTMPQFT